MKKFALFTALVLSLTMLSGCYGEEVGNVNDVAQTVPENTVQDQQVEENGSMDAQLLEEAVSGDLDLSKCDEITREDFRNFCIKDIITTMAVNELDVSFCDQLKIQEDVESCKIKVPVYETE